MMKTHSITKILTLISIGILLSGFFFSVEVLASSMKVSLDELVERSDLVISGTVVGKSSYREPSFLMDITSGDGKGNFVTRVESSSQILTDFEIKVSNVISGSYDESVIHLTVMGGTVGNESTSTSLSFGLTTDKEYILFLGYEKRNDKWWAVAGRQGFYEKVGIGSKESVTNIFKNIYGERLEIRQFISRIRASTHEKNPHNKAFEFVPPAS